MPSDTILNRYQSIRQYYFNPSNLDAFASQSNEAIYNNYLNPGTVITSLLQDQKNILRYQGMKPVQITSNYIASKSGTRLQMLISKILSTEDANFAINGPSANAAIIAITNFDASINISDYEILIFDDEGYRISDFENCTWFVINNTLYIVHLNCTKYRSDINGYLTFAETVDVVLMRRTDNSSKIRAGKLSFFAVPNVDEAEEESFVSVTDELRPMTDMPSELYLKYNRNYDLAKDSFLKYNTEFYGVAIYLSEYIIDAERDGLTDFDRSELKYIQDDINFNFKSWMFINPSLYTIENDGDSIIVKFNDGVSTVEDLGLKITARNPRYNPAYVNGVQPIIPITVKTLATHSAFYLYNKATFMGTEFSYTAVKNNSDAEAWDGSVSIRVSPRSTVPTDFIVDAFKDAQGNINYGPKYIPLAWEKPSVINDTETYQEPNDTDAHIYSRWLNPEDVFVFVDGVKLTPYVDYIVVNEAIEGEDFPVGSIAFVSINSDNVSTYAPFPMADWDSEIFTHYIQVFTIPPSISYNKYKGPHYDNLEDKNVLRDDTIADTAITDSPNTRKAGIVDMNNGRYRNLPISMLGQDNYITFKGGKYVPIIVENGKIASPKVILDNELSYTNLSNKEPPEEANPLAGYRDVEVHTYFEESKSVVLDNLVGTISNYSSYIEDIIEVLGSNKDAYEIAATSNVHTIDDEGCVAKEGIAGVTANNFELWLRHNTLLRTTTDIHSETKRRVPDRQTYFSAGEDLSAQGYTENIRVSGAANSPENYGMPLDTASNDVHNIDDDDTEENNEG